MKNTLSSRIAKIASFFLLLIVWLAGCAAPTPTPKPDLNLVATIKAKGTPTPTITVTPTVTQTLTATPDLTSLGKPEEPFLPKWPKPVYNEKDFDVVQRNFHGRTITIAWEKSVGIPENFRDLISQFYFNTWLAWWEIFQGFPYETYTVVMRKNGSSLPETGVGYTRNASQYGRMLDGALREKISKEVLHAWVGNALCDSPELRFEDGLWFREGITQYFGDRAVGKQEYFSKIAGQWNVYKTTILGTKNDIPLVEMPIKGEQLGGTQTDKGRAYRQNVATKGALVAYMMDEELGKSGHNLDDFLRSMYENYTLNRTCFTTKDSLKILNEITGKDWTNFYKSYIYGKDALPLTGTFQYIDHQDVQSQP
jgi:hypothetical protein